MRQVHEPKGRVHWTSIEIEAQMHYFCHNSRAQSKYAVINLIHTRHKYTFFFSI